MRLRDERGMVLVMAVGISTVLLIAGTTAIAYSTSGSKESAQSRARQGAASLAEGGINNALSVLNLPTNNAMLQRTLPACTSNNTKYSDATAQRTDTSTWNQSTFDGGSALWCGTYVSSLQTWYLAAIGATRNPNRSTANVSSTAEATVTVTPNPRQQLGNPVWNYIYAGHTGSVCDQTLNNNVNGSSRLYVAGNLCIGNNAAVSQSAMSVIGNLTLSGGNTVVGSNASMATRVEAGVGGNCSFGGGTPVACTGNQDALKIYSKVKDANGNFAVGVNHAPVTIPPPTADYATWYRNAIPGPAKSCDVSSGPVPTFDTNYPTMDNNVAPVFNLTPSQAYDCRVGPAATPSGEIRWTPPTATLPGQLYMTGTIFIDGSASINTGTASSTFAVQYSGMSALYLSGTFYLSGKLCATITSAKTDCDFPSYDPNNAMITVVANGTNANGHAGDGILIDNNSQVQGSMYATNAIEFGNVSYSDGPVVGSTLIFGNNVTTNSFANIDYVPAGDPGNDPIFGHPNPPGGFSG